MKKKLLCGLLPLIIAAGSATAQTPVTFSYTGSMQMYVVPSCVNAIDMDVRGAQGGLTTSVAGLGGRVQGHMQVHPGDTLYIFVGGHGNTMPSTGGFNGGGNGSGSSGGGGGASDIRTGGTTLNDRFIVAGGGGGNCDNGGISDGGAGGGLTGGDGNVSTPYAWPGCLPVVPSTAGTQTAGGLGGTTSCSWDGSNGGFGFGGNSYSSYSSGGGGGGWYGGGGGQNGGSGAGGSSYTSSLVTSVVHEQGFQQGHGQIIITPVTGTPPVVSLGSNASYCGSVIVQLDAGNPGWNYSWSTGASTQVLSVSTSGTYYVTVSDSFGCSGSDTVQIQIHPNPSVSISNLAPVCGNDTAIMLTGASPAGGTWWGTGVDSLTGIFDPYSVGPGTYTINYDYTDTNGCSSSTSGVITVNAPPNVTLVHFAPVCSNMFSVMFDNGGPIGGYYMGPGVWAGMFHPMSVGPGTYAIEYFYTDSNNCTSSMMDSVHVLQAPVVSLTTPTPVCLSDLDIVLNGGSPAGGTYYGQYVDTLTGVFSPSSAYVGSFSITYVYTDSVTGCSDMSMSEISVESCVGIDEQSGTLEVSVLPNPSQGMIEVGIAKGKGMVNIHVTDATGRSVGDYQENMSSGFRKQLDLSSLPKGIYFVKVTSSDQQVTRKIVLQ